MAISELDQGIDVDALGGPALRTFFNLAKVWELSEQEQMKLLGLNSRSCTDSRRISAFVGHSAQAGRSPVSRSSR